MTIKGVKRKKMALIDKTLPPKKFSNLFQNMSYEVMSFSLYRFNVFQTKTEVERLIESLQGDQMFKIQDFSQNYTCEVPNELQAMHWPV